ncbi:MAG: hypothetical protein KME42_24350 [Tildeniella nuda ZEHNDER 1965/U140]|nr:hypothetical protein [Tildeniella nuda ZEHNDER 1965/U140]
MIVCLFGSHSSKQRYKDALQSLAVQNHNDRSQAYRSGLLQEWTISSYR